VSDCVVQITKSKISLEREATKPSNKKYVKDFARVWWGVCVTLLALANTMLFVYFMLLSGFWSRATIYPLFYLFQLGMLFSYYCAAPLAAFGFVCALGCSIVHQTKRAALLASLSGGALFSAILVWSYFRL